MTREEEIIAEYEVVENRKLSKGEKDFILNVLQWVDEHPKNPWISVEERLPGIGDDILLAYSNGKPERITINERWLEILQKREKALWMLTPTPELKKG